MLGGGGESLFVGSTTCPIVVCGPTWMMLGAEGGSDASSLSPDPESGESLGEPFVPVGADEDALAEEDPSVELGNDSDSVVVPVALESGDDVVCVGELESSPELEV